MTATDDCQTLSPSIAVVEISIPEALRHATELADALRRAHREGRAHGALTPDSVLLTDNGLQLLPTPPEAAGILTPYTAPEQIHGQPPDACTDIFSFGAIVYEMFTGRQAFTGATDEALARSICVSSPAPIGHEGIDQLVFTCLSKDRAGRWQRMQQVVTELKLLGASARRAEAGAATLYSRMEASLCARVDGLDMALSSRLDQYQERVAALLHTLDQELSKKQAATVETVSGELNAVGVRLASVQEHAEKFAEALSSEVTNLRASMAGEIQGLQAMAKAQSWEIESVRSATVRTDDLIEGVVDALGALQTTVFEQSEAHALVAAR